jgi:hypothetical protein
MHVLLFVLASVVVLGMLWRATRGRSLPSLNRGVLHLTAVATHRLLDPLLLVMVALGITDVFAHGFPRSTFGIFRSSAVTNFCAVSMSGTD